MVDTRTPQQPLSHKIDLVTILSSTNIASQAPHAPTIASPSSWARASMSYASPPILIGQSDLNFQCFPLKAYNIFPLAFHSLAYFMCEDF